MIETVQSHARQLLGSTVTVVGAISSYQEQIEWHLRQAASLVAIAAGLLTIISLVKKWRADEKKPDEKKE